MIPQGLADRLRNPRGAQPATGEIRPESALARVALAIAARRGARACLSQYAFPAAAPPRGLSRSPALDERKGKQCKSWLFHGRSPRE
jgi:hypothetical protein